MNYLIGTILILNLVDYILTLIWVHRWRHHKCLKDFKKRVPFSSIEANPIIQYLQLKLRNDSKAILIGFIILVIVQTALANLTIVLGFLVVLVQAWAIGGHIKNNILTSKDYIIDLTKKFNEVEE